MSTRGFLSWMTTKARLAWPSVRACTALGLSVAIVGAGCATGSTGAADDAASVRYDPAYRPQVSFSGEAATCLQYTGNYVPGFHNQVEYRNTCGVVLEYKTVAMMAPGAPAAFTGITWGDTAKFKEGSETYYVCQFGWFAAGTTPPACVSGYPPLHIAAGMRQVDLQGNFSESRPDFDHLKALVAGGADVNEAAGPAHVTPLQAAAATGTLEMAQYLVDHGAVVHSGLNPGEPALNAAVGADKRDMVDFLLAHGAQVNAGLPMGALGTAIFSGNVQMADYLLTRGAQLDPPVQDPQQAQSLPLPMAAGTGRLAMVRLLLDRGASVPRQGGEALLAAVRGYKDPQAHMLMMKAFSPHGKVPAGYNPPNEYEAIIRLLISRGVNPNYRDSSFLKWNALFWADASPAAVRLLLQLGVNPNVKDAMGQTPLTMFRSQVDKSTVIAAAKNEDQRQLYRLESSLTAQCVSILSGVTRQEAPPPVARQSPSQEEESSDSGSSGLLGVLGGALLGAAAAGAFNSPQHHSSPPPRPVQAPPPRLYRAPPPRPYRAPQAVAHQAPQSVSPAQSALRRPSSQAPATATRPQPAASQGSSRIYNPSSNLTASTSSPSSSNNIKSDSVPANACIRPGASPNNAPGAAFHNSCNQNVYFTYCVVGITDPNSDLICADKHYDPQHPNVGNGTHEVAPNSVDWAIFFPESHGPIVWFACTKGPSGQTPLPILTSAQPPQGRCD